VKKTMASFSYNDMPLRTVETDAFRGIAPNATLAHVSDKVLVENDGMMQDALELALKDAYRTREQYKLSRNAVKHLRKEKTRLKKLSRDYLLLKKLCEEGNVNLLDLLKDSIIVVKPSAHAWVENSQLYNSNYAETESKNNADIW
jgi:hypothetical protein